MPATALVPLTLGVATVEGEAGLVDVRVGVGGPAQMTVTVTVACEPPFRVYVKVAGVAPGSELQ